MPSFLTCVLPKWILMLTAMVALKTFQPIREHTSINCYASKKTSALLEFSNLFLNLISISWEQFNPVKGGHYLPLLPPTQTKSLSIEETIYPYGFWFHSIKNINLLSRFMTRDYASVEAVMLQPNKTHNDTVGEDDEMFKY